MNALHFTAGRNRPEADGPDATRVSWEDAINYVIGCTGRDRGLVTRLVNHAQRKGAVYVQADRGENLRSVCLVRQDGPMPVELSPDAVAYLALGMGDRNAPRVPDGPRHREAAEELSRHGFLGYAKLSVHGSSEYQYVTAKGARFYTAGLNA